MFIFLLVFVYSKTTTTTKLKKVLFYFVSLSISFSIIIMKENYYKCVSSYRRWWWCWPLSITIDDDDDNNVVVFDDLIIWLDEFCVELDFCCWNRTILGSLFVDDGECCCFNFVCDNVEPQFHYFRCLLVTRCGYQIISVIIMMMMTKDNVFWNSLD